MSKKKSAYLKSKESKSTDSAAWNPRVVRAYPSINKSFVESVSPEIVKKNKALQSSSRKMGRILLG